MLKTQSEQEYARLAFCAMLGGVAAMGLVMFAAQLRHVEPTRACWYATLAILDAKVMAT